jgi:oligopeptide/dipeptide ABC transporter ATP-binding protein
MTPGDTLLDVRGLTTVFHTEDGTARAVDGVSFSVGRTETFCLVGESGCGKSVTALSIMRLVPSPPGEILRGKVTFDGADLLSLPLSAMRSIRGNRISMVFQEPLTALNPVMTVGTQIGEAVRLHRHVSRAEARAAAREMLVRVHMPEPDRRLREYPHQLSGGMQQRAMVAMALACAPELLIADEPTTALDVTTQARVLDLLRELQAEMGMAVLLITHDLGVVAQVADRVAVMYAGRIVEQADAEEAFRRPQHPYLRGLLDSLPSTSAPGERLKAIRGFVPDATRYPPGCRFAPRCDLAVDACSRVDPELREVSPDHLAACVRVPGYWAEGETAPQGLAAAELEDARGG